jgi:lipopolysaccharide transport system ATP-binding protein
MYYGLMDIARDFFDFPHHGDHLRDSEYWAVDDLNFSVHPGECIGVIGPNGSGKSTLLKMISGIYPPDTGQIRVRGRIGTLIEVGAGFHPMLSGRENIFVNGAILGLRKKEIEKKFDEIVEFSGLEEFIDSPLRHYSSGMHVRLGFAIAAHMEPRILLVDEALAVGDFAFRAKCLNRIAEMRENGTAIVFVSHSEMQVRAAANRCLLLDRGRGTLFENTDEAIHRYREVIASSTRSNSEIDRSDYQNELEISGIQFEAESDSGFAVSGKPLHINVNTRVKAGVNSAYLILRFWNHLDQLAAVIDSRDENRLFEFRPGEASVSLSLDSLSLVPGRYRVAGGFRSNNSILGWSTCITYLDIHPGTKKGSAEGVALLNARYGLNG